MSLSSLPNSIPHFSSSQVNLWRNTSSNIRKSGFQNPGDFCLWNGKSGNFFLLEFESVILLIIIGIWNLRSTDKNFASSTWNPESTASNSESKIWLDSLTWGVGWNARSHLGRFTKHFSHEIWLLKCGGKIGFGGLKGSCLRLWVTRNQFLMNTTVKGYKIKRTTKFKFLPSIKAGLADRLGFSR